MWRWLMVALVLALAGCAQQAPLPSSPPVLELPLQLHVARQQAGQTQDWLLVLQQEGPALRWSLMDPLGIPLARQLLLGGEWQNDGLLPPNPEARELFAALLFALTPAQQLVERYPHAQQPSNSQRSLGTGAIPRWQVTYQQPLNFQLSTQGGLSYRVEMLP